MKKNIYTLTAVFLVLFAGCDTITMPDSGQSADGRAAVSLAVAGEGARTVLPALKPDLSDVKAWKLLGGKTGETQAPLTDLFTDPASQTLYLETGDWDFTLKGYKDESGETLILEGTITQSITLVGPNTLEFTVAPLAEGEGTVKITITLPVDHGITQVKVFKGVEELDPITPTVNSVVYEKTGHAAGDYFFSFRLFKGEDLYGTVSELVQVRANLASGKTYTLEKEDLNIRYAITYEMDNGTFNVDDPSYYYYQYTDADFTLPTPTREGGWTFLRWYVDNPDTAVTTIPANSTGAKTFWAKWHKDGESLASTTDIRDYLAANIVKGNSADDPIALPVNINLADGGWADLLSAIQTAQKFVALDLSVCAMGDGVTEFDPVYSNSTGKGKIVSLVLPDAAESVKGGTYNNPTFKNFSVLKSVTGKAKTIGNYAFYEYSSLTEVNLPNATTIGERAFEGCTALETLNLLNATTIGESAFEGCTALETVDLPEAITIEEDAFFLCYALEIVALPKAETIGNFAFQDCFVLKTVDLSNAKDIGDGVFRGTGMKNLTVTLGSTAPSLGSGMFWSWSEGAKTVTVRVPTAAQANYDTAWQNTFKAGGSATITLIIQTY